MSQPYASVRMHASAGGRHVSGAERLVPREDAAEAASALFARGWSSAAADRLTVSVETVAPSALVRRRALPVRTAMTRTPEEAMECTIALLGGCGVASVLAARTLKLLRAGPGPAGRPMRGAMIVDAVSGERLEPDPERGVRVSHMDFSRAARGVLAAALGAVGIEGHRPMEALALATKAADHTGDGGGSLHVRRPDLHHGVRRLGAAGLRAVAAHQGRGGQKRGGALSLWMGIRSTSKRTSRCSGPNPCSWTPSRRCTLRRPGRRS